MNQHYTPRNILDRYYTPYIFHKVVKETANLEESIREINRNYKKYRNLVETGNYELVDFLGIDRSYKYQNLENKPINGMLVNIPFRDERENYIYLESRIEVELPYISKILGEVPEINNKISRILRSELSGMMKRLEERYKIAETFMGYIEILSSFAYHTYLKKIRNGSFSRGLNSEPNNPAILQIEESFYISLPKELDINNLDSMVRMINNWNVIKFR